MKKCKSCQTEIDSKATKCPHCHADQRNWFRKHPIITGILALIVLSIIGSAAKGNNNSASNSSTTTASANNNQQTAATPTAQPTAAPINLSGVGQQASQKFQLGQGLAIFKLTHTGSANFIVDLLDSKGQSVDIVVNDIGTFNGSKAENIKDAGTYVLDIKADGNWTADIEQPRPAAAPYTTSFSGKGQQTTELFSLKSGLKTINMTHDGTANFIVSLLDNNGNEVDNLVNEIGKFNGSKAEGIQNDGIYLLNVQADGNWTINIK